MKRIGKKKERSREREKKNDTTKEESRGPEVEEEKERRERGGSPSSRPPVRLFLLTLPLMYSGRPRFSQVCVCVWVGGVKK